MRTRIVRLVSPATSDAITNFVNRFEEDMLVRPNAEVAMINATIPLDETLLVVQTGINDTFQVSYDGGNTYKNITIPAGSYTANQIVEQIQSLFPQTSPDNVRGVEWLVELDAKGYLTLTFWQTKQMTTDYDPNNPSDILVQNVNYDDTTDTYSPDLAAGVADLKQYIISTIPMTLGTGLVEVNIKSSPSTGSTVHLGLGRNDVLQERFETDNEIAVTATDDIVYAISSQGTSVFYYHEDGNAIPFTANCQDGDELRMDFFNTSGKVRYSIIRAGNTVEFAEETFTPAVRYQANIAQLTPYVGLPSDDSVCSNISLTPAHDPPTSTPSFYNKTMVLRFPERGSEQFYGFVNVDKTVTSKGADGGVFQATSQFTNTNYIPAISVELSNMDLQTYDGSETQDGRFGRRRSIVAVIPGIEPQLRSITYEPSEPTYVAMNNRDEMNLNRFEVRLLTEDNTYLKFIPRTCLTLAIRD